MKHAAVRTYSEVDCIRMREGKPTSWQENLDFVFDEDEACDGAERHREVDYLSEMPPHWRERNQ